MQAVLAPHDPPQPPAERPRPEPSSPVIRKAKDQVLLHQRAPELGEKRHPSHPYCCQRLRCKERLGHLLKEGLQRGDISPHRQRWIEQHRGEPILPQLGQPCGRPEPDPTIRPDLEGWHSVREQTPRLPAEDGLILHRDP